MNNDEDEFLFQGEIGLYERVGLEGVLLGEKDLSYKDPSERFYIFVDAIARQLKSQNIIYLSENNIQYLLKKIDNVPNIKYKNPTGYVLGYYVIDEKTIDKKKFNLLKPHLSHLNYPMKQTDVLRYANLWLTQLI